MVKCPLCGKIMVSEKYEHHMSHVHPEFQVGWFPPKEIPEEVKVLDESDSDEID